VATTNLNVRIDAELKKQFVFKWQGKPAQVLWEGKKGGVVTGHTRENILLSSRTASPNTIEEIIINKENIYV